MKKSTYRKVEMEMETNQKEGDKANNRTYFTAALVENENPKRKTCKTKVATATFFHFSHGPTG